MDNDGSPPDWYVPGTMIEETAEPTWTCPDCLRHGLFVRLYYVSALEPPREMIECPRCDYSVEAG